MTEPNEKTWKRNQLTPINSDSDVEPQDETGAVKLDKSGKRILSPIKPQIDESKKIENYESSKSLNSKPEVLPEDKKSCKNRFISLIKILVKHFGSFVVSMAYMALGGFLFVFLELDNEKSSCIELAGKFAEKYNSTLARALSYAASGFNDTVMTEKYTELILDYAKDLYSLSFDPEMDCTTIGEPENLPSWNFVNSMYFSATIMTTIGYGHISPSTMWGQIVCIIYSVIGIPIMLIFLSNIGDVMANVFRYLYLNMCCCKCFVKHYKHKNDVHEDAESLDNGHENNNWAKVDPNCEEQPPPRMGPIVIDDDEYTDEEEDYADMEINVPITVTLILLITYILIGAGLFMIWEKWTIVEATYFSFITLSTIGFGDYYPAKDSGFQNESAIVELFIGMMYCFIGLAWLSMCINLIQDEIAAKILWLGQKVGCIKKDEEESVEEDNQDHHGNDTDSCLNEVEPIPPPITRHSTSVPTKGFSQTEC